MQSPQQIFFIDGSVDDIDVLIADLGADAEIVILSDKLDGVTQMANYLDGRENIDEVHLLSHGSDGALQLGNGSLDSSTIGSYGDALAKIGAALSPDADILLYGCDVAATHHGRAFVDQLALATGADVAASNDLTGAADLGGDWALEVASGSIEADVHFGTQAFTSYAHTLATTITFSSEPASWDVNHVAIDGTGGSADFVGITLEIFNISDTAGTKIDAIDWWSSVNLGTLDGFTGIAVDSAYFGTIAGIAIKSSDGSDFEFEGFDFYDSGFGADPEGSPSSYSVVGYLNGAQVATSTFTRNTTQNSIEVDVSAQTDFDRVDEVRIVSNELSIIPHINAIVVDSTTPNAVPVLGNPSASVISLTEGVSLTTPIDTNFTVSDADSTDFNGGNLTVTISSGENASQDQLSIDTSGTLSLAGSSAGSNVLVDATVIGTLGNAVAPGNDFVVNFNASANPTNVQTLVQALNYTNTGGNDVTSGSRVFTITLDDGDGGVSAPITETISVSAANDEPTLTATGANPTFVEGGVDADLFNTITASTVETGQTVTGLTLTITNVTDASSEVLSIDGSDLALTNGNSITTATNGLTANTAVSGTTATVSFSGATLSTAALQTLVDGLTYSNTSDTPSTAANRVVTITQMVDSGGTLGSGDDTASLAIASTVSLTAVNNAPSLTGVFSDFSTVISRGAGASDLSGLNDAIVTNPDSDDHNGGTITIAQTTGSTNGSWSVDGTNVQSGGDATVSAGETITVGGTAIGVVDGTNDGQAGNTLAIDFNTSDSTSANITTLLTNLEFEAPSVQGTRTFSLSINDNDGTANGGTEQVSGNFSINVASSAPVITGLDGESTTQGRVGFGGNAIDQGVPAVVSDSDTANFNGGNLTIETKTPISKSFWIDSAFNGGAGDNSAIDVGQTISVDGNAIGTVTSAGVNTDDLVITFNTNDATPAAVSTFIQELNVNGTFGRHDFDLTITEDGSPFPAVSDVSSFSLNLTFFGTSLGTINTAIPRVDLDRVFNFRNDNRDNVIDFEGFLPRFGPPISVLINGKGGNDTVVIDRDFADIELVYRDNGYQIVRQDGPPVRLSSIETLQFNDQKVVLDTAPATKHLFYLYEAMFDRSADLNGLTIWTQTEMDFDTIANMFLASDEFKDVYGENPTNEEFVEALYLNALDRQPDQGGFNFYTALLNSGVISRADVLGDFVQSDEMSALFDTAANDGVFIFG